VGLGMLFILLTVTATVLRWRGTLFGHRWLMWLFVAAVVGALAANEVGWVSAEVGRQPWSVYAPLKMNPRTGDYVTDRHGHFVFEEGKGLRTADAVSPAVSSGQVLGSIIAFGLIYVLLGMVWLFVLDRKIRQGPEATEEGGRGGGHPFLDSAARITGHGGSYTEAHSVEKDMATD
jgi:cytochrome bd ubiquinol oxidase subunit I